MCYSPSFKWWACLLALVEGVLLLVLIFYWGPPTTQGLFLGGQKVVMPKTQVIMPWNQVLTPRTENVPRDPPAPVDVNPIPSVKDLRGLSKVELINFYHRYINSPQVPCRHVERMGYATDGGWEMCDDPLYKPDSTDCLVYSYGINYDFSFDDAMAKYGCEVHSFDPSMTRMSDHLRGTKVHFHKLGIGNNGNVTVTRPKNISIWTLDTFAGHRKQFGHQKNQRRVDILKMDVESYEKQALPQAVLDGSMDDVRQLTFEIHGAFSRGDPSEEYIKLLQLLRLVYDAGFRIYATHRNTKGCLFFDKWTQKQRVKCHEVHTVNIKLKNTLPSKLVNY